MLEVSKRMGQPEGISWGKQRGGYTPERGSYVGRGHSRLQFLPLPCDPVRSRAYTKKFEGWLRQRGASAPARGVPAPIYAAWS
jgi:hypothetical protein